MVTTGELRIPEGIYFVPGTIQVSEARVTFPEWSAYTRFVDVERATLWQFRMLPTLLRRARYGGRKGASAKRRLAALGVSVLVWPNDAGAS